MGEQKTLATGISPGATPAARLLHTGLDPKLQLDLGPQRILIAFGADPKAALTALRDDLTRLLGGNLMALNMTVKFATGSDTLIEGFGVRFGWDLDGQRFTEATERHHEWFPNGVRPLLLSPWLRRGDRLRHGGT